MWQGEPLRLPRRQPRPLLSVVASDRELLRELAARAGGVRVTCAGRSMEPVLRLGEQVTVRACAPATLAPGDVVLFAIPGGAVELHRLVLRVPAVGAWLHRGDNQATPALGVVRDAAIIGRADLPRRRPTVTTRLRAVPRLVQAAVRAARRRLGVG